MFVGSRIELIEEGVDAFALPVVVAVVELVCARFNVTVNDSGWIRSAYFDFHLSKTG